MKEDWEGFELSVFILRFLLWRQIAAFSLCTTAKYHENYFEKINEKSTK